MPDQIQNFIDRIAEGHYGYLWFVLLALWGGTVNYISRVRQQHPIRFSLMELIGEWSISGFVGIITIYICLEMQLSTYATGALVAISGHMGGRAIFMFEAYVIRKIPGMSQYESRRNTGIKEDERNDDV